MKVELPITPIPKGRPRGRIVTGKGHAARVQEALVAVKRSLTANQYAMLQDACSGPSKQFIQWYTTAETREFEKTVGQLLGLLSHDKVTGPVELRLTFRMARPKSVSAKKRPLPCVKPDLDNLIKSVLDGAQDTIFEGDAVVCKLTAEKVYCEEGAWPSIEIEVLPMLVEEPTLFKEETA